MQDSPKRKMKHVSKNKSIIIPTSVLWDTFTKDITTKALIDCGSQLDCIDHGFVQRHNLPKIRLSTPIRVKNVDGTYNEKGTIKFVTHLFLHMGTVVHQILFHIMGCGNESIILWLPWLKKINPRINWVTETVVIPRKTDQTEAFNYKTGITHLPWISPKWIWKGKTRVPWQNLHKNDLRRTRLPYPKQVQEKGKGIHPEHTKDNHSNQTGKSQHTTRDIPSREI